MRSGPVWVEVSQVDGPRCAPGKAMESALYLVFAILLTAVWGHPWGMTFLLREHADTGIFPALPTIFAEAGMGSRDCLECRCYASGMPVLLFHPGE